MHWHPYQFVAYISSRKAMVLPFVELVNFCGLCHTEYCSTYLCTGINTSSFCRFLVGKRSYAAIVMPFVESYLRIFAGSVTSKILLFENSTLCQDQHSHFMFNPLVPSHPSSFSHQLHIALIVGELSIVFVWGLIVDCLKCFSTMMIFWLSFWGAPVVPVLSPTYGSNGAVKYHSTLVATVNQS